MADDSDRQFKTSGRDKTSHFALEANAPRGGPKIDVSTVPDDFDEKGRKRHEASKTTGRPLPPTPSPMSYKQTKTKKH